MDSLSSPWREIVTLLIGGGLFKGLDWLLAYRRQRSELRLVDAQADGESVGNLERRVTATVKVIDIYQEASNDFADALRGLRGDNRELKQRVRELEQENAILREIKALPKPGNGKGN
jgi:hypothetical protein